MYTKLSAWNILVQQPQQTHRLFFCPLLHDGACLTASNCRVFLLKKTSADLFTKSYVKRIIDISCFLACMFILRLFMTYQMK